MLRLGGGRQALARPSAGSTAGLWQQTEMRTRRDWRGEGGAEKEEKIAEEAQREEHEETEENSDRIMVEDGVKT